MTTNSLDLYISKEGKDYSPGTQTQPFASLERAFQELKTLQENGFSKNINIILDEGHYFTKEPLKITPELLPNGGSLTFKAAQTTHPVISGGYEIKEWEKQADGTFVANLPKDIVIDPPRGLFINGDRRIRARYPNDDYLNATKITKDGRSGIYFDPAEIPNNLTGEFEVVHLSDWTINRATTDKINYSNSLIEFDSPLGARANYFRLNNHTNKPRFFLEDNRRFLDAPGEWFFEKDSNRIIYNPQAGESPDNLEAFIPISQNILSIEGTPENKVKDVHFEGISFAHANWVLPEPSFAGIQAIYYDNLLKESEFYKMEPIPAAVTVKFAENGSFRDTEFSNLNTSGLYLGIGTNNFSIERSHFHDISGSAIFVGEGGDGRQVNGVNWEYAEPNVAAFGNEIKANLIENIGVEYLGSVGIGIGLSHDNVVRDNIVRYVPYTGISVGFKWGIVKTPAYNNLIEYNYINNSMQELSDGAGIYTLGYQPGTIIRDNTVDGIPPKNGRGPSGGIYLDQGSDSIEVAYNTLQNIIDVPIYNNSTGSNWIHENTIHPIPNSPKKIKTKSASQQSDTTLANDEINLFPSDSEIEPVSQQNAKLSFAVLGNDFDNLNTSKQASHSSNSSIVNNEINLFPSDLEIEPVSQQNSELSFAVLGTDFDFNTSNFGDDLMAIENFSSLGDSASFHFIPK
jgi:Right handed beta helix region